MSEIKDNQKEYASKFMSTIWNELIKPYYNAEDKDEWWVDMMDKANAVASRYGKADPRLTKMITGFIRGLEETKGTTQ